MNRILSSFCAFLLIGLTALAQEKSRYQPKEWTNADQQYLLENLIRTKEALITETAYLTESQWHFKEAPDRWSINQIVEHIAIWELILLHEAAVSLQIGPIESLNRNIPDSTFLNQDPEVNPNKTESFTKPFTYTIPRGYNEGIDNISWWLGMRTESIDFIQAETRNLRKHYINFSQNVHQQYMVIFSHTDRHLKQILKVKAHPNYPK
ncbi:MAG: DinB family protein [Cytophagales bacterium]|nr:DinB family protein [Cytophagales bacterium]